eukprot:gene2382-3375_t
MLDETAEGNLFSALRVREADLEKHLQSGQGAEQKDEAREKAREEARKKLEEESGKKATPPKPLPEFGSDEDFQLSQAVNRLKGKPVLMSKTIPTDPPRSNRRGIPSQPGDLPRPPIHARRQRAFLRRLDVPGSRPRRPPANPRMNDDQLLRYSRHILLDDIGSAGRRRPLETAEHDTL